MYLGVEENFWYPLMTCNSNITQSIHITCALTLQTTSTLKAQHRYGGFDTSHHPTCSTKHTLLIESRKSFSDTLFLRALIANMPASVHTDRNSAPAPQTPHHTARVIFDTSRGLWYQSTHRWCWGRGGRAAHI
jgi:hypothetical protein